MITVYEPPRCPNYVWTEPALKQLEYLQLLNILQDLGKLSLLYNTETGIAIPTKFDLVLKNLGEYNKHCDAIDAYLDTKEK